LNVCAFIVECCHTATTVFAAVYVSLVNAALKSVLQLGKASVLLETIDVLEIW
jgi:hypothetical protein